MGILGIDDSDLSKVTLLPATKREMLDKLQVRLMVFEDRIEVNAVFPKCRRRVSFKGACPFKKIFPPLL